MVTNYSVEVLGFTVCVSFRNCFEINNRKSTSTDFFENENDLWNLSLFIFSMVVEPGVNTAAIENAVKERINGAEVARYHGKELAFQLPSSESNKYGSKICYTN